MTEVAELLKAQSFDFQLIKAIFNKLMPYQKISNSKVLVTGGAGFIGSNLCEDLLKTNNQVICLDNFIENTRKLNALAHIVRWPIKIFRKKSYASKALAFAKTIFASREALKSSA